MRLMTFLNDKIAIILSYDGDINTLRDHYFLFYDLEKS